MGRGRHELQMIFAHQSVVGVRTRRRLFAAAANRLAGLWQNAQAARRNIFHFHFWNSAPFAVRPMTGSRHAGRLHFGSNQSTEGKLSLDSSRAAGGVEAARQTSLFPFWNSAIFAGRRIPGSAPAGSLPHSFVPRQFRNPMTRRTHLEPGPLGPPDEALSRHELKQIQP